MPQLNYSENMAIARRGMKATTQGFERIISRAAEGAAGIAAGRFVRMGTLPLQQAKLPAAEADILTGVGLGVVTFDAANPPGVNALSREYDQYDVMPILRNGCVWVEVEDTSIVAGAPCYVRHTAASPLDQLGIFSSTDDANTAALPGAVFITSDVLVTYGNDSTQLLACVDLSMPGGQRGPQGEQGEPGGGD